MTTRCSSRQLRGDRESVCGDHRLVHSTILGLTRDKGR